MKPSHRAWSGAVIGCVLGGCVSDPALTPVVIRDDGVTSPTVRIVSHFAYRGDKRAPSEARNGHAIEFNATSAEGGSTQTLGAGQPPLIHGGTTFFAPQVVTNEFDFLAYRVMYRWRRFDPHGPLGLELLAGLGYSRLGITVSSPTQRGTSTLEGAGVNLGSGLIWRLLPATSLEARLTTFLRDFTEVRVEAHAVQALGRNAAVRAGYAFSRIRNNDDNRSDIKVNFSGFGIGLDLNF